MKLKNQMELRIRDMLTKDKLELSGGFMQAFSSDLQQLFKDYFEVDGKVEISVKQNDDCRYAIKVVAHANKINEFETTFKKGF